MKKLPVLFALMFASHLYANVDYSETYIKFLVGDSYQQTKELGQTRFDANTILAGMGLGYDFKPSYNIPLRSEILYQYRTNNSNHYLSTSSTLNTKIDTLMLNFYYDFYKNSSFTPYVVGGFGLAFPRLYLNSPKEGAKEVINDDFGYDGKKLALNIGSGVTYQINKDFFSSAGLMYTRVGSFTASDSESRHHINYMNAFDFILSVSYRF